MTSAARLDKTPIKPKAQMPPRPLSRFQLVGLKVPLVGYPDWMYNEHYQTPCGVSISECGTKTHPAKLNAKQRAAVAKVLEVKAYYDSLTAKASRSG